MIDVTVLEAYFSRHRQQYSYETIRGAVYDSWQLIKPNPNISDITDILSDLYVERMGILDHPNGVAGLKEQHEELRSMFANYTLGERAYDSYASKLTSDSVSHKIQLFYERLLEYQTIHILSAPYGSSFLAASALFKLVKLVTNALVTLEVVSRETSLKEYIEDYSNHHPDALLVIVGYTATSCLNVVNTNVVVIDSTPFPQQDKGCSNQYVLVLSAAERSITFRKTLPIGAFVYFIIEGILQLHSSNMPSLHDYRTVLCALSIISDTSVLDIESKLIVTQALHIIQNLPSQFTPGTIHNLRWLMDLSLALSVNLSKISLKDLAYTFAPVLVIPIRYRLYDIAHAIINPEEHRSQPQQLVNSVIQHFNNILTNRDYFSEFYNLLYKNDKKTGGSVLDKDISDMLSRIMPYLDTSIKSQLPQEIVSYNQDVHELPFYADNKAHRTRNYSQLRLIYTMLYYLMRVRRSIIRQIKVDYMNLFRSGSYKYGQFEHEQFRKEVLGKDAPRISMKDNKLVILYSPPLGVDIASNLTTRIATDIDRPVIGIVQNKHLSTPENPAFDIYTEGINQQYLLYYLENISKQSELYHSLYIDSRRVRFTLRSDKEYYTVIQLIDEITRITDRFEGVFNYIYPLHRKIRISIKTQDELLDTIHIMSQCDEIQNIDNKFYMTFDSKVICEMRHFYHQDSDFEIIDGYVYFPISKDGKDYIPFFTQCQKKYGLKLIPHIVLDNQDKAQWDSGRSRSDCFYKIPAKYTRALHNKIFFSDAFVQSQQRAIDQAKQLMAQAGEKPVDQPWKVYPLIIIGRPVFSLFEDDKRVTAIIHDFVAEKANQDSEPGGTQTTTPISMTMPMP